MKSSGSMASCGPRLGDVLLQPRYRPLSDRHVPVLVALALANQDQATVQREVEEFQMDDFKAAHSGAVQDFQQRPVAQADGFLDLA